MSHRMSARNDGQADRIIKCSPRSNGKDGVSVLPDLFRSLKQTIMGRIIVVFTVLRGVVPADLRASLIGSAVVVRLQVLAICQHHDVPRLFVNEHAHISVHHVPPDVIKVFPRFRSLNRKCEIATTPPRAVGTKDFTRFEVFSLDACFRRDSSLLRDGRMIGQTGVSSICLAAFYKTGSSSVFDSEQRTGAADCSRSKCRGWKTASRLDRRGASNLDSAGSLTSVIRSHLFPDVPMTRISPACPRVPGSAHALAAQRFAFEQHDGTDIHWGSNGTHLACAEIGTIRRRSRCFVSTLAIHSNRCCGLTRLRLR